MVLALVEMDSLGLTVVVTLSLNMMCVHAFVLLYYECVCVCVVVTLSVNMMCTHLYYCSMRCLYCNMSLHCVRACVRVDVV